MIRLVLCLTALTLLAPPASAQDLAAELLEHVCVLRAADPGAPVDQASLVRLAPHTVTRVGGGATFEVTYSGFTAEAEAAFQRAVDIWADHVQSAVPIRVNAQFGPLAPNVLGSAGAADLTLNRASLPFSGTVYPIALAEAIEGAQIAGVFGSSFDINATFSSTYSNFYFGTDGNPPAGTFDFATVVLHELGHGLGFAGSGTYEAGPCPGSGEGCFLNTGLPFVYDRFVEDAGGEAITNGTVYPEGTTTFGDLLTSNQLYSSAPSVTSTLGARGRLYAPGSFMPGSSYSHWNEGSYSASTSNALMTPQIALGESHQDPGPNTCAFFNDMGWPLGPGCALVVDDEAAPAFAAGGLRVTSQNPGRGAARLRLTLGAAATVRAELTDLLGRRLAVLYDGAAPAGELSLTTPAGLAPGSYLVRVQGDAGVETARLVRL